MPRTGRNRAGHIGRWLIAYVAGAWMSLEILDFLTAQFGWPIGVVRAATIVAVVGFFAAAVVAFHHGPEGRQRVPASEAVTLAGLALVAGVWIVFGGGRGEPEVPTTDDRPAVAVLACQNFSPDPEDEYLANGMHEEILMQISKVSSLRLLGRETVTWYRTNPLPIADVADSLGVGFIGQCSVRKDPGLGEIRLSFQLLDSSGAHIWGRDYDRTLTAASLFELQSDIARRVASGIGAELASAEDAQISEIHTDNLEAYQLYLLGRFHDRRHFAEDDARRAVAAFEEAVGLDPDFAPAWAALAEARVWLHWVFREPGALAEAERDLDRARSLDPDLAEGHAALGEYYYYGFRDYDRARQSFERFLELRPADPDVYLPLGAMERRMGDWAAAEETLLRAIEVDPRNMAGHVAMAELFMNTRRFGQSAERYQRAIDLFPDVVDGHQGLALARLMGGDRSGAAEVIAAAPPGTAEYDIAWSAAPRILGRVLAPELAGSLPRLSPEVGAGGLLLGAAVATGTGQPDLAASYYREAHELLLDRLDVIGDALVSQRPHGRLGLAAAGLGRWDEARDFGRQAVDLLPPEMDGWQGPDEVLTLVEILIMVGDYDEAIDRILELLAIPSLVSVPLLEVDPLYDPVRDHPRFRQLLGS